MFRGMMTQWRTGMNGPTGLDYATLPAMLRLYEVPDAQHRDVFEAIRVLEDEALTIWANERKRKR